jgi:putative ABC transport system substrate-binding protein
VFSQVANPVGAGFAASLARPGGNITGFTNFEPSMGGKWLELLKEVAPRVARTAAIFNPETHSGQYWQSIEAAAPSLAVTFTRAPVRDAAEIERTIEAFARDPNGGLLVMPDSFTLTHRELIVALAERRRLPSIYAFRVFPASCLSDLASCSPADVCNWYTWRRSTRSPRHTVCVNLPKSAG